jgi:hypothetical protein
MNQKRLFLLVLTAGLLLTCKNHYVIELLKAPSELLALNVTAYSGTTRLEGGVSFEPGFSSVLRDYAVYIPDEATYFVIEPDFNGKGTVLCLNYDRDNNTGPEDLGFSIEPEENILELILTVQRENLAPSEYRLNIMRAGGVPVPKGIVVSVNPSIGSFFLERGVVPELSVSANAPEDGGVFSYQWYRNYDNNNRSGTRIEGATETSYLLSGTEITNAETVYYYVVITNTVDGKTGSMESMTRPITFIDKEDALDIKSRDMVRIEENIVEEIPLPDWYAGTQRLGIGSSQAYAYALPWKTSGFYMGKYPVTWELWKLVFDFAEAGGYHFASKGNQGAEENAITSTRDNPRPVGNKLHPVTMLNWNDCVVWCNAYSEMEGLEPVYRDARGNILRDARDSLNNLVDGSKMAGKNGYRLPNFAEWEYADRGADLRDGIWYGSSNADGSYIGGSNQTTVEVGSLYPNGAGLYDMVGLVSEWGWDLVFANIYGKDTSYRMYFGSAFSQHCYYFCANPNQSTEGYGEYYTWPEYMGLRPIRDLEPEVTP